MASSMKIEPSLFNPFSAKKILPSLTSLLSNSIEEISQSLKLIMLFNSGIKVLEDTILICHF